MIFLPQGVLLNVTFEFDLQKKKCFFLCLLKRMACNKRTISKYYNVDQLLSKTTILQDLYDKCVICSSVLMIKNSRFQMWKIVSANIFIAYTGGHKAQQAPGQLRANPVLSMYIYIYNFFWSIWCYWRTIHFHYREKIGHPLCSTEKTQGDRLFFNIIHTKKVLILPQVLKTDGIVEIWHGH